MTTRSDPSVLARTLIMTAATILALASPIAVAAHAELQTSTPGDGSSVAAPFAGPIVMTFTEAVTTASSAELLDGAGTVPSSTAVDGATMTLTPKAPLAEGDYEVRWTSVADDGHIERGTFRFIATAATTPAPTASSVPSVASTPSPAPTAAPSGSGSGTGGDAILPIVAGAVLVGVLAVFLLRRRDANANPS